MLYDILWNILFQHVDKIQPNQLSRLKIVNDDPNIIPKFPRPNMAYLRLLPMHVKTKRFSFYAYFEKSNFL